MRIGVLENSQDPSESAKHFVTGSKARKLVDDMRLCARCGKDKIRIIVEQSWSVIKAWLSQSSEQREAAETRARKMLAMAEFPSGAEFSFTRWPCEDQRSMGIGV